MIHRYTTKLFLFFIFFTAPCIADQNIDRYLELFEKYPKDLGPVGDWTKGEMQLILDPSTIIKIQSQYGDPLGVVAEDKYWMWLRDAIILPNGKCTGYNRFFPKHGLNCTHLVATLAITPNKELLVNLIFRHATRSWEIELPRGGANRGETPANAAAREVKEETGYTVAEIIPLGAVAMDSGISSAIGHVFFARTNGIEKTQREDEECISTVMTLPKDKAIEIFCQGQMECTVNGQKITAFCRDSYFAYALLMAEKKGLL
ncbi:MAG: pyrophosphohydrolase including oxidative damage repair enzyme [Parachlamydiales bacterium]|nr:pyrophosphohydrolase including oxidative damage repair enzyme [Parachlamydiales bacterium]